MPIKETYDLVRSMRPETLISYKQGATGEEDFASPEHSFRSQGHVYRKMDNEAAAVRADDAWEINRHKHNEICTTLQTGGWGYNSEGEHCDADAIWEKLHHALTNNCNLLANVGPLPDGSIHPADVKSLREVGKRIKRDGWPV